MSERAKPKFRQVGWKFPNGRPILTLAIQTKESAAQSPSQERAVGLGVLGTIFIIFYRRSF